MLSEEVVSCALRRQVVRAISGLEGPRITAYVRHDQGCAKALAAAPPTRPPTFQNVKAASNKAASTFTDNITMDPSQLWYCPHRPDFLVLTPCDTEEVPCSATMVVSLDHMHQPEGSDKKWRHPKSTAWVTCFGDVGKQQPRIVRCACGQSPCQMRSRPHNELDDLIPKDWATNYVTPATLPPATEQRRESAIRMWLDCTGKADNELPRTEGGEHPQEEAVTAAAEVMLTDYLKGRVCFNCNLPSTKMSKCGSCSQARYCSRECQRSHWGTHKVACKALAAAAAAEPAAGAAAAGGGEAKA